METVKVLGEDMIIELNDEILHKVAIKHATEWDTDLLIDELVYLYKNLSKYDSELKDDLIQNYFDYLNEGV